jgi:hypothetical protein
VDSRAAILTDAGEERAGTGAARRLTAPGAPLTLEAREAEEEEIAATGQRSSSRRAPRRLVITVCPREPGVVVLPVSRGERARRLDAQALVRALRALVAARRLDGRVGLREGCAGGCSRAGPNVDVTIHPVPRPGEKPNHVAMGWRTYVYSLASLDCLATIIDENLGFRPKR